MGTWSDDVDFYGETNAHIRERRACRWLVEGNGQKVMHLIKRPEGPHSGEHTNLVEVHKALVKRGLVTVSPPDYFGWRWVRLTAAGFEFARDHS